MGKRLDLHDILKALLGSENVYFQPPEAHKMSYPCIKYTRSSINTVFADNAPYANTIRYTITVIDKNPDSIIPGKVGRLPLCRFDRHYTSENLNHDVYNLYY